MSEPDQLPALPEPVLEGVDYELWGQNAKWDCYSKGQMQDYALTAIATERARADALQAENAKLKTTMVAAAEEIAAHWDAHCDAEGYGPQNLMRRLEEGIPTEYGYTAGAFAELKSAALLGCGHHVSLMLKSAETGASLYCELCDDKSGRADAERMEQEYRARADALEAALRELVDLKTLKLRMERSLTKSMAHGNNPSEQYHTWKDDYNHRKPAAWAAARALLEKKT